MESGELRSVSGNRARLYRTQGVVLRRRDLGEADRILTVYTDQYGKLRLVAKGTRRTKSRLAGHLEPFSRTSLLIAKGRNLDVITQASLIDPYKTLRQDESLIAYAGYFADLLDAFTPDAQENVSVYELLVAALERLDRRADPGITAAALELRLLGQLGFRPELEQCIVCGRSLEPVTNGFSVEGGVLCPECTARDSRAEPLSVNALKFLRLLERGDDATAYRLRLAPELRGEIERHLRGYVRHVLERDLSSLAVLRTLTH